MNAAQNEAKTVFWRVEPEGPEPYSLPSDNQHSIFLPSAGVRFCGRVFRGGKICFGKILIEERIELLDTFWWVRCQSCTAVKAVRIPDPLVALAIIAEEEG